MRCSDGYCYNSCGVHHEPILNFCFPRTFLIIPGVMSGADGNSSFCFPKSLDVSRRRLRGIRLNLVKASWPLISQLQQQQLALFAKFLQYSWLPITCTFKGNEKRSRLSGDWIPADTTYHMYSYRNNGHVLGTKTPGNYTLFLLERQFFSWGWTGTEMAIWNLLKLIV